MGREHELQTLQDRLASARNGHGGLYAVTGPPGIGKTTLVGTLSSQAAAQGGQPLAIAATAPEFEPPLGLWSRLAIAAGAAGQPVPAQLLRGGPDTLHPHERYAAVHELLHGSGRRPTLIVLEDLHGADESSLTLLWQLAPALASLPVLVVATWRTASAHPHPGGRAALSHLRALADGVELPPLTPSAVTDLILWHLDSDDPDAVAWARATGPMLCARTGGNAYLLSALLRHLGVTEGTRPAAAEVAAAPIGDDPHRLAARWLQGIDTPRRRLLVAIAHLGDLATATLLGEVFERDVDEDLVALQELGVLERPEGASREAARFTHPTLAEAVRSLPVEAREQLHLRIAERLRTRAGPHELVAALHHLVAAGRLVASAERLVVAEAAASAATRLGDHVAAVGALEQALAAAPQDRRPELLVRLAETCHLAGRHGAAWAAADEAAALLGPEHPDELARAALQAARGRQLAADTPRVIAHLRAAERALDESAPRRAEVLAALAVLERGLPTSAPTPRIMELLLGGAEGLQGDPEELVWDWLIRHEVAAPLMSAAEQVATAADEPVLSARVGLNWRLVHTAPAQAGERAARSRAALEVLHDSTGRGDALFGAVIDHLELGDRVAADGALGELDGLAEATGDATMRWRVAQVRAMLALAAGDPAAAGAAIEQTSSYAQRAFGVDGWLVAPLQAGLLALETMPDPTELLGALEEDLDRLRYPPILAAATAFVAVRGSADRARAALPGLVERVLTDEHRVEAWLLAATLTADAVVATGQGIHAGPLAEALMPFADLVAIEPTGVHTNGSTARSVAGLLALTQRRDEAAALYTRAREIDRRMGFERFVLLGRIQQLGWRLGDGDERDRGHVQKELRDLADAAQRRGLALVAASAQRLLTPDAPPTITDRQQRVLERLAAGATYQRIAAELGYSHSTVRHEAMRVYAALGVPGRDQAVVRGRELGLLKG